MPVIEEFPVDTHAVEGKRVHFKVCISGVAPGEITWFFKNQRLTSDYSMSVNPAGEGCGFKVWLP